MEKAAQKVVIHLHSHPAGVVLRVDEMSEGDFGIKIARQAGEISLKIGRNEVDADLWDPWHAQHKDDPILKSGIVTVETKD